MVKQQQRTFFLFSLFVSNVVAAVNSRVEAFQTIDKILDCLNSKEDCNYSNSHGYLCSTFGEQLCGEGNAKRCIEVTYSPYFECLDPTLSEGLIGNGEDEDEVLTIDFPVARSTHNDKNNSGEQEQETEDETVRGESLIDEPKKPEEEFGGDRTTNHQLDELQVRINRETNVVILSSRKQRRNLRRRQR